jgi:16S rRNA (cytidine1402-2'-O)-methyltransferase
MKGFAVDSIPGASAPLAAAVASGFPLDPLTIFGFAPARSNDRKMWLERLHAVPNTLTFFETPRRILQTLSELHLYFGERPILVARELTKRHQELQRFQTAAEIGQMPPAKGEFTIVVGPAHGEKPMSVPVSDDTVYGDFCRMTAGRSGRRAALAAVAAKYGYSTKAVYAIVERLKKADA